VRLDVLVEEFEVARVAALGEGVVEGILDAGLGAKRTADQRRRIGLERLGLFL
jgi:hypothetical protein